MRSAVYFARPETFSGPSIIGTYWPIVWTGPVRVIAKCRARLRRQSDAAKLSGMLDGFDYFDVSGAAANVAAERRANLVLARASIVPQQADRRHHVARCTITTLGPEFF